MSNDFLMNQTVSLTPKYTNVEYSRYKFSIYFTKIFNVNQKFHKVTYVYMYI